MQNVRISTDNGIRTISINRPLRRNAFDAELIEDLTDAFRPVSADDSLRAVILTAEGTTFCSGGDLAWMKAASKLSREENLRDAEKLFDMFKTIRDVNKPVIGQVFGHCFGGGVGLVAACDLVAAEGGTQFCFSEVKWGLVPAVISPFIVEKAAPHLVREWFLTAKVFGAQEAAHGGLVNFVGSMTEVETYVAKNAALFREAAPRAVAATKRLHQDCAGIDWAEKRRLTTELIADRRTSPDGQYGLECFLNKSKPDWMRGPSA